GPTRRTEQQLEFRGEYPANLRLPVVPRHRHTARPMREVRQVKTEFALVADVKELTNLFRKYRLPVRSEAHRLELVAILRKTQELRDSEVEQAQRVREEHPVLDCEACATADPRRRADEIAESVNRTERRVVKRTGEIAARQMRRMMFHVVHAGCDVRLVQSKFRRAHPCEVAY